MFEHYAGEAELASSTWKRWSKVIQAFVAHLGHDDLARITADDLIA
jgi:hypothetical protein